MDTKQKSPKLCHPIFKRQYSAALAQSNLDGVPVQHLLQTVFMKALPLLSSCWSGVDAISNERRVRQIHPEDVAQGCAIICLHIAVGSPSL